MSHGGGFRIIGADGVGPYATETECAHEDVAKFDNPAVKIMFQVTQIVKNHCTFPA